MRRASTAISRVTAKEGFIMARRKDMASPISHNNSGKDAAHPLNGSYVETVRERAYQLYEMRCNSNNPGDPMTDWLQAEQLVRDQLAIEKPVFS